MTMNTDNIKEIGAQIYDMLPRIELMQQVCNALMLVKNSGVDKTLAYHQTAEALSAIFEQSGQLYRELDTITFELLECDNDDLEVEDETRD